MERHYGDIGRILAKYPEITPDEDATLQDWLRKDRNRQIFEDLTPRKTVMEMLKRADEIKATQGEKWQKLLNRLDTSIQPERTDRHRIVVFWLSAAASVIIIASVLLYTIVSHKKNGNSVPSPAVANASDVKPGQFKAKLTLADGSTIILDSANTGTLVQQDEITVLNNDGKLIYKKRGESNKVLYNTLSTAKAQTYATILSDGTKVWLNSESSIHYPVAFNGDIRKVEITGEAYFEVATSIGKNGKRPFIVSVNGMEVEVLGTHFNINSYWNEEEIKTTLLEGKVRVHSAANDAETVLKPGEQAIVKNDNRISVHKDVDVDAEVAWRFGFFNFDNADLKTVMRQLERWYDVEIVYEGKIPDAEFLGKIPRDLSLSQVLAGLQSQEVHFRMVGKKIIVTP